MPLQPYEQLQFATAVLGKMPQTRIATQTGSETLLSWGSTAATDPPAKSCPISPSPAHALGREKIPSFVSSSVLWKSEVQPLSTHKT